jgi:ribose transport system ATP-binding protein
MAETHLSVRGITKDYPGVRALDAVDVDIRENEVVGLIGENGAGKSTLLNVMSGITRATRGEMLLRGQPFLPTGYHDAMVKGVDRVFQEQALVPNLRVYENMFLSHEKHFRSLGIFLDRRKMAKTAAKELALLGLDIDPTAVTEEFSTSTRQLIEIARACTISTWLGIERPLILLDEPTASLPAADVDVLFDVVHKLKERASFVFISHRLTEILELSDRIYVMKDGAVVAETTPATASEATLHALMVGRERVADYYRESRQRATFGEQVLAVDCLTCPGAFSDVSVSVRAGEIVGIGGVIGSGKSEVGRAIAGIIKAASGHIRVNGSPVSDAGIVQMMDRGVAYMPPERHTEGVMLGEPIDWNMSLASLHGGFGRNGWLDLRLEREQVTQYIQRLGIKAPSRRTQVLSLSGGNQQKVVLAKWLMTRPKVLILDNPTHGIDAGAKEEIYELLRNLADDGVAILVVTDDLGELIGLSDRILVMKDGRITSEEETPCGAKPSEKSCVANMV